MRLARDRVWDPHCLGHALEVAGLGKHLPVQNPTDPLKAPLSAGEDGESIKPTLTYLHKNGIGGILDYAAESDVDSEGGAASRQVRTRRANSVCAVLNDRLFVQRS